MWYLADNLNSIISFLVLNLVGRAGYLYNIFHITTFILILKGRKMKKSLLFWISIVGGTLCASAQLNPITDLYLEQGYDYGSGNSLYMNWQVPEPSEDTLVGYNVYRETELYRFQESAELYFVQFGGGSSNCGVDFLFFHDMQQFYVHVTAVYGSEHRESIYTDSVYVHGPLLNTTDFQKAKPIVFPNPTSGLLSINFNTLKTITVYDLKGKMVKTMQPSSQVDISSLKPGIYFLKLATDGGVSVQKIILE